MRTFAPVACLVLALAGCVPATRMPAPPETPPEAAPLPPEPARAWFSVEGTSNDTWNAVGQLLVRTPEVHYEGRAQILGLYAIRYRGTRLRIVTRAMPLTEHIARSTTQVTLASVVGAEGAPGNDGDAVVDLMLRLQRELPAEIVDVRAKLAARAQDEARKAKAKTNKRKK